MAFENELLNTENVIALDPATNPIIQEFLDTFATDPVIRLDVEKRLTEAAHVDSGIKHSVLTQLADFTRVLNDPKTGKNARAAIKFAANQAVMALLNGPRGEGVR